MEKNIPKNEEGVKNSSNSENNEQKEKKPESLARFDSVDEFKDFLNQSKENIVISENQIKQRQEQKETNEKNAGMGEKQTKEYNDKIDIDIQKFQDKTLGLQKGLNEYDDAFAILRRIDIAQKQKETNEKNAGMGEKQTKGFNDKIDVTIAELNKELEEMVVKKEEEKKEESRDTGVSKEKEKSLDEILVEEIKEALEGKDSIKIKDIARKVYEMEKGEGANISDFGSVEEMKKYLQEKLEELQNKSKREEHAETVGTTNPEESKDTSKVPPEEKAAVAVQAQKEHEAAMADKEMLYSTKIDLMEEASTEEKEKLKNTVEFVNKEKVEEYKSDFEKLVKLSLNEKNKKGFDEGVENLSELLDLDTEVIAGIIDGQKANLEELTYQQEKRKKSKKESKWKKIRRLLPKIALYGGAAGLGFLTGGTFAVAIGVGMGAFRITGIAFKGKKDRKAQDAAILESEKMLLDEIDEGGMSEEDKKEKNTLIQTFYDDIFIKLAIEKQNQIDGKGKEFSELGKDIAVAEEGYNPKDKESKEELNKLYAKRRNAHKEEIKKYLEEQGMSGEELDNRVKLSAQLVEIEDNQNIMELGFTKRKAGAMNKIFAKIDSVLSSSLLLGGSNKRGDQNREKLITAGIFAVAGTLARSCPMVRNILMAYAGMKLGSAASKLFVSRENKELLKQVSAESINLNSSSDDISKAKSQLLDQKFKETDPVEHAKLQDKVFAYDRAKMEALLGKPESDENEGYIGETNKRLEETIKKRRVAKDDQKGMKIFLGVAGGVAGYFIGDYLSNKSEIKAEEQARQEELSEGVQQTQTEAGNERLEAIALAEKQAEEELRVSQEELAKLEAKELAELNKEIIVEKGDTSWSVAENGVKDRIGEDEWAKIPQHEKDYIIDAYKDKMVANADAIGIDGGDASSLRIGDSLDIKQIFSDPNEMTTIMGKAKGLSPEAIQNIIANREIIGNVMSQKLENVSGDNLIKAMNIMGGSEQSGAGFVQELQNRATEVLGAEANPEQMQTILNNPDIFGEVMRSDGNLVEIPDSVLHQGFGLINGNEDMTVNELQKTLLDQDSPVSRELWRRLRSLQNELHKHFGPNIGINEVGSNGGVINTPVGQGFSQTMKEITTRINEQGDKLIRLSEKTGFFSKLFGVEGRIEKATTLFNETVGDFKANVDLQQKFINESGELSKKYIDLTGGKFFRHYVENYAKDQAKNIKNVAGKIVGFSEALTPTVGNTAY